MSEVTIRFILRDFETAKLADYARLLRWTVDKVLLAFPGVSVDVVTCVQYRNMAEASC